MKEISAKKWGLCAIAFLGILVVGMALLTYLVDPYFHFHKPLAGIKYRLYEQRYINDGISRHFEYDAVITGNSLSENTKSSEFDQLFGCNSIKLPYSGAGFKELWTSLDRTLSYNPDVKKVLVIMDYDDISRHKDYVRYNEYPEYLYDDNIWNDASYLWNKEVFYRGTLYHLLMTVTGSESTTFDEYSSWQKGTGAEVVMPIVGYIRKPEEISAKEYGPDEEKMVVDNITENVISVIKKYPQIQFYLIYSPPSIAKWCSYNNQGETAYRINGSKTAAGILLNEPNVQLYSFMDEFDMICNLENYSDTIHYNAQINSYMLHAVSNGTHQLTLNNYKQYFEEMRMFYTEYDYRSLAVGEINLKP